MTLRSSTMVTMVAMLLATSAWLALGQHARAATDHAMTMDHAMGAPAFSVRGKLPTEAMAGKLFDTFGRHRECSSLSALITRRGRRRGHSKLGSLVLGQ